MSKIISIDYALVTKYVGTAFLCAALAFSFAWPTTTRAETYTIAELQSLLNQILAQLNALQGGSMSDVCPYVWTRSLGQGSTGMDVMRLQQFLNSDPDTGLAVSGVGSKGLETQYYGPLTARAVSKFQSKYRVQILAPLGLVNPTGYFGPSSMAQANRLCQAAVDLPGDDNDDGDLEGGAGSIGDVELMPGISGEEVGEGEDGVEVLGLEVEAEGSDIELTAVTVNFDQSSGADNDLEDYAEEVSIWLDGEEYASVDADEFEDDEYEFTISLDDGAIIREGDVGELVVAVTGLNNIDSENMDDRWEVAIDNIRFRDADGATLSNSSMDDLSRTFTFVEFAESSGLGFTVNNGNDEINDSRSIQVSDDDSTDDIGVLSFEVETEGDSDLTIEDLRVSANTTGGDLDDLASAAYLYMDGDRVGSESITSASSEIVFDDVDLDLEADETYEFEVRMDFREADGSNYDSGATIDVDVTASDRDAWIVEDERGDDVDDSDRRGSASGDAHTLVTEGARVRVISSDTEEVYNSSNPSASYGEFRMVVEVEAIGDTIYVAETAERDGSPSAAAGATYYFISGNGNEYAAGTGSDSFNRLSGGSVENGFVRLNDGQTARFELVATINPDDFGQYRLQLASVGWNDTAAAPDSFSATTPASGYRTGSQTISD